MDLRNQEVANAIMASTNALYLYDSLLTLSQEVDGLWTRKWTSTTWIYALTRYSAMLSSIVVFLPAMNYEICQTVIFLRYGLRLTQWLCFTLFITLRTYALLYGTAKVVPFIVFALNMVPFAVYIFSFASARVEVLQNACVTTVIGRNSEALRLRLSLVAHIAAVAANVVVLVVIWFRTFRQFREARRLGIKAPLTTLILRDGTAYFLLLLIVSIFQVLSATLPVITIWVIADALISSAVPIIVCRLILNLRQIDHTGMVGSTMPSDRSLSIKFVGDPAGPLHTSIDEGSGEEESVTYVV